MALSFYGQFLAIIDKWRGKAVDYDKAYGFQCVDWVKQYVLEQYKESLGTFGGSALTGWTTAKPFNNKWVRVPYRVGSYPEIGDIVFLNATKSNPYGHVCIADNNCDGKNLRIIEENAGSGNGDGKGFNAVTQRTIRYDSPTRGYCLGWFHRK